MKPKEKAKEIYKKVEYQLKYNSQPSTLNGMCKQICLLICDEIINSRPTITQSQIDYNKYWKDVIKEIEKL